MRSHSWVVIGNGLPFYSVLKLTQALTKMLYVPGIFREKVVDTCELA